MRTGRTTVFAVLMLAVAGQARAAEITRAQSRMMLRDYALAACLTDALPAIATETWAAADGYLQNGTGPAEAYMAARALSQVFLKRNYPSFRDVTLDAMKCIDLSHSRELEAIVDRYLPLAAPRRRSR